ncbi:MAG: Smr/MutS family protein [Gammaproteobacteria bacterium]|nr:Smr/MutS family protein [Gammaproteobacteria bacterium]
MSGVDNSADNSANDAADDAANSANDAADDAAAFREAMRGLGVKPRAGHDRHAPAPPGPTVHVHEARAGRAGIAPRPGRPRGDRGVLLDTTDGGEGAAVAFARGGVQKSVVRRLKRGDCRPAARLDLHGLTAAEAESALDRFLARAGGRGQTELLVIHGKGLRSGPRGGVLKGVTCALLKRHPAVQAFCSAHPKHGGHGAVYVLIKNPRRKGRV